MDFSSALGKMGVYLKPPFLFYNSDGIIFVLSSEMPRNLQL